MYTENNPYLNAHYQKKKRQNNTLDGGFIRYKLLPEP